MSFYLYYQKEGKESAWTLALASDRAKVVAQQPAFITVLDLTGEPADGDWSKVKYLGPMYFDFDADGDLDRACKGFRRFLASLANDHDIDLNTLRLYASGGKGFHIEIPMETFFQKVPTGGVAWLPYIYRRVAEKLYVDTLDLNVYTAKKGRQWRTPGVRRESGTYKVPLSAAEAQGINAERYAEIIRAPRPEVVLPPPRLSATLAMAYDQGKEVVQSKMRGKKKRQELANKLLDPLKRSGQHLPTILALMRGENIHPDAGFQHIAMQLAVYATSMDIERDAFVEMCEGLVENHVSDGWRYATPDRRRRELLRMYDYMADNALYDFETGPIISLLRRGYRATDLGQQDMTDPDAPPPPEYEGEDGDPGPFGEHGGEEGHDEPTGEVYQTLDGIFAVGDKGSKRICNGSFTSIQRVMEIPVAEKVEGDAQVSAEFQGYMCKLNRPGGGKKAAPVTLFIPQNSLTSAATFRKVLTQKEVSYTGDDSHTQGIMSMLAMKANRRPAIHTYPYEGFSVIRHPEHLDRFTSIWLSPGKFYTSHGSSAGPAEGPEGGLHFELKLESNMPEGLYKVDLMRAADFALTDDKETLGLLKDLFQFNEPEVVARLLGWFSACFLRPFYLINSRPQFPLLFPFGTAGSGKTQTSLMLSGMHWVDPLRVAHVSAVSLTPFMLDSYLSGTRSVPLILDEYKPSDLLSRGRLLNLQNALRAAYNGMATGERGNVNKATGGFGHIRSLATAPLVVLAEALETQTAIVERIVPVQMSKRDDYPAQTAAFERLSSGAGRKVLSTIGYAILSRVFRLDLNTFNARSEHHFTQVKEAAAGVKTNLVGRPLFNVSVLLYGLELFGQALKDVAPWIYLDDEMYRMCKAALDLRWLDKVTLSGSVSEVTKVLKAIASLSWQKHPIHKLTAGEDYFLGDGWVDVAVQPCWDKYVNALPRSQRPLFENCDSFATALNGVPGLIEADAADSVLIDVNPNVTVYRFNTAKLGTGRAGSFKA